MCDNQNKHDNSKEVYDWTKTYLKQETKREESLHRQASSLLIASTILCGAFFALIYLVFRLSSVQSSYFIRHYIMLAVFIILMGFIASILLNMFAQMRRNKTYSKDFIDAYQELMVKKDPNFNYALADNIAKLQREKKIANDKKTSLLNASVAFLFLSVLGTLVFFVIGLILVEFNITDKYLLILICCLFIIALLIIGLIAKYFWDKKK